MEAPDAVAADDQNHAFVEHLEVGGRVGRIAIVEHLRRWRPGNRWLVPDYWRVVIESGLAKQWQAALETTLR